MPEVAIEHQVDVGKSGLSDIITALQSRSREYFGTSPVEIRPVRIIDGPYSRVIQIRVSGASDLSAYIKMYPPQADHAAVERKLENEFYALQRTRRAMAGYPGLTTVRPIACFPDQSAIVTEAARGQTISEMLKKETPWTISDQGRRNLLDVFLRAGQWLKAFQRTGEAERVLSTGRMRDYIDKRLLILLSAREITPGQRTRILDRFDDCARQLSPADLLARVRHSDFCFSNIAADENTITVLDLADTFYGSRLSDLAHLFMHIESAGIRIGPWVARQAQEALLQGFDPELHIEDPLFQIELLSNLVAHRVHMHANQSRWPARLYSWVAGRGNRQRFAHWSN